MQRIRSFVQGPWRAVLVFGVTQILAWGVLFYPPVLMMPLIAAEHGWSLTFAMGCFSGGLLVSGLVAPYVGASIDRFGGHGVMALGSVLGACGLALLTLADHPLAFLAAWALLGVAMSANLYDSAFATLGRIFGAAARSPITALTLAGGLASTVSWPATHLLLAHLSWRDTYLIYAAILLLVAAPLHAFALPREKARPEHYADQHKGLPPLVLPAKGLIFVLVATGFAIYAFVPSGLVAHMLAIFERSGVSAESVVTIGALFGPAQVGARLCEFVFGRNLHPLALARAAISLLAVAFALLGLFGISLITACLFVIMFGAANGLITIARGAVPLALFGAVGYGRLLGRIAKPFLLAQAASPLVIALVIERGSDKVALALMATFTLTSLVCLFAIRRPQARALRQ